MRERLEMYLTDHLAGANAAIALLRTLRHEHAGQPLGTFAAEELNVLLEDKQILEQVIRHLGTSPKNMVKERFASMATRLFLIKPRQQAPLGILQHLELLSMGIVGRIALWKALSQVAEVDNRLQGYDFPSFAERARDQYERFEARRLASVREGLSGRESDKRTQLVASREDGT